ncbi:MAG TPA: hypothetical protein VFI24_04585 [Pyrinomonadaceae bacterium]|nr:hypothetical protein [Pyrinomonadaceae bacterium]
MNESEDYYVTAFSAQFLCCNFGAVEGSGGGDFVTATVVWSH